MPRSFPDSAIFNTGAGDAWEFADVPYYPAEMTTLAYRYGVNYVIYSILPGRYQVNFRLPQGFTSGTIRLQVGTAASVGSRLE